MAVEKMKLINIIGPLNDFDRVVMDYVIDSSIHLENMFDVFINQLGLMSFEYSNPYGDLVKRMDNIMRMLEIDPESIPACAHDMTVDRIAEAGNRAVSKVEGILEKRSEARALIEANNHTMGQLKHIETAEFDLNDFFNMKNIKVRFGKMPRDSYKKLNQFLGTSYATVFFKFSETADYIYGVYCSPISAAEKIDTLFSSLYFERMRLPDEAKGVPRDVIAQLKQKNGEYQSQIDALNAEFSNVVGTMREQLQCAYRSVNFLHQSYDIRRYSAHTAESFYLAGWIPESGAEELAKRLDDEPNVTLLFEEPDMVKHLKPPTKLKNNWFVRPFEKFVDMYGLPSYNEFDPTALFALTYSLMFGMMYGDVGHGLVLSLLGLLMEKKGNFLGPILKVCGIAAAFFGVLYGSIFGFEVEHRLVYKPMNAENMMPTLIMAVAVGAAVIGICMIFNIANGMRQRNVEKALFGSNGLAGFIFYWAVILGALSVFMGNNIMRAWYVFLFVVLPLTAVFLKEPLAKLVTRKKDWMPKNKGEYILENLFEMLELMLSYITNTISFIRVGAFALNHAGMMMVVYSLANVSQHSFANYNISAIGVLIVGNILVLSLEGLLVAIQVLRLEFYEMFSRYYSGEGKRFSPKNGG